MRTRASYRNYLEFLGGIHQKIFDNSGRKLAESSNVTLKKKRNKMATESKENVVLMHA